MSGPSDPDTCVQIGWFEPRCSLCGGNFCQPEFASEQLEGRTFFYHLGCAPESDNVKIHQVDVDSALVYGILGELPWPSPPPGMFENRGNT